ncbi:MAG: hypothetical protein OXD54_04615 [Candidatus Poribacteria bacterium]|nr:hypothetical protein [Candidatus Poribacteria bacterium]
MKRTYCSSIFGLTLLLFLIAGVFSVSEAELESLKIEISDVVTHYGEINIRRLLTPWADPKDITFHTPVDKNGRKRHFTTVVEVKPRRGVSKYSETHAFDVYDIMRQLKDSRYRGRHGISQVRLIKTEVIVKGRLFSYPGYSRSYIRDVPLYARYRSESSELMHALTTGPDDQKYVFTASPEFDQLRIDAAKKNEPVEIHGKVVGFDGPYPILKVSDYKIGERSYRRAADENAEKKVEKVSEEKKPKYDYLEDR